MSRVVLLACLLWPLLLLQGAATVVARADPLWQPGPGAAGSSPLAGHVDSPAVNATVVGNFTVTGWVVDTTATGWTGIVGVDVVAGDPGPGTFLGSASIQQARPDVVAVMGNPFWAAAGFTLAVSAGELPPGTSHLTVVAHTPAKGSWTLAVPIVQGSATTPTPSPSPTTPPQPTPSPAGSPAPPGAGSSTPTPTTTPTAPAVIIPLTAAQQAFVTQLAALARQYRSQIPVQPSLVVAMGINESGFGISPLAQNAHNYFGITAYAAPGPAGTYQDQPGGMLYRAYHTMDECVRDLGAVLQGEPYASQLHATTDPLAQAQLMVAGHWAGDPAWVSKLAAIIQNYNLAQFN